jgi:hypothetical protein
MDATYVFLCGIVWLQFGTREAGRDLILALSSRNPQLRMLARTLLEQAGDRSKELIGEALATSELSGEQASLFDFESSASSGSHRWSENGWYPGAFA